MVPESALAPARRAGWDGASSPGVWASVAAFPRTAAPETPHHQRIHARTVAYGASCSSLGVPAGGVGVPCASVRPLVSREGLDSVPRAGWVGQEGRAVAYAKANAVPTPLRGAHPSGCLVGRSVSVGLFPHDAGECLRVLSTERNAYSFSGLNNPCAAPAVLVEFVFVRRCGRARTWGPANSPGHATRGALTPHTSRATRQVLRPQRTCSPRGPEPSRATRGRRA